MKRDDPNHPLVKLTAAVTRALAAGAPEYIEQRPCFCPDDCNCHYPWRTNYCGCRAHVAH